MVRIIVATKVRGFLENLFNYTLPEIEFNWNKSNSYEINSKKKIILSKLAKSKLADYLGIIQRIKVNHGEYDFAFSYNRFLKTSNNYIICMENPTALFHYSLDRNKTFFGKRKINRYLKDEKLKIIVCISNACYSTVQNFYEIPNSVKVEKIYPLVPINPNTSIESIKNRSKELTIRCVYVSANFTLKGGKDILESFKILKEKGYNNLKLTIVTRIDTLDKEIIDDINNLDTIELLEFNLNKKELLDLYDDSSILLNPTRQDSFALVMLEAMKAGNTLIGTDLYAINEIVEEGKNGFLIKPKYRFFNYNNMPNEYVWENREKTIYSDYTDLNIVESLVEKLALLYDDRELLENMSLYSFNKSNNGEFSEKYIKDKWTSLLTIKSKA